MAEQNSEAVFQMQRVYIKDASLELPNAPKFSSRKTRPKLKWLWMWAHNAWPKTFSSLK